jgi:hypothetical protein
MGVNTSVRARDVRVSPVTAEVFAVTAAGAGGGGWAAPLLALLSNLYDTRFSGL